MEAISSSYSQKHDVGFMDPMALKSLVNNKTLNEGEKVDVATKQFESIFIKEFVGKGMKPMFGEDKKAQGVFGKSTGGYADTFVPEIVAQRLAVEGVFGLSEEFKNQIEQ